MGRILGAYITPHPPIMIEDIGGRESQKVISTIKALEEISRRISEKNIETIVIITPHGPMFRDGMAFSMEDRLKGDFKKFGAFNLEYEFKNDIKLVEIIMDESEEDGIFCIPFTEDMAKTYGTDKGLDHGALVPLHFIHKKNKNIKLVHITYSGLSREDHYKFGRAIKRAIDMINRNCAIIASGDLSHRLTNNAPAGYDRRGQEYDNLYVNLVRNGDALGFLNMDETLITAAGECAYRATLVLLGTLDKCNLSGEVLSYEGPFGVGYAVAELKWDNCIEESPLDKYLELKNENLRARREKEDPYVKLARTALENKLRYNKQTKISENLPREMIERKAGVFVTIKKSGELRGCIGTITPTRENVAYEIIQNATSAGLKDPRFLPIDEEELDELSYSVDVLGEAEEIDTLDKLDPNRYGIIVKKGMRRGLLLPNLEGVDTVEKQLNITLQKAGIGKDEDYKIERFEVIRHK